MNDQLPSPLDHWNSDTPVWTPYRPSQHSH
ncbi:hypothetical protein BST28156_04350 [Burkholderia stagnalis]|nr:hypothetical protein BST28156_04350 [Burkholderia stagnalis]